MEQDPAALETNIAWKKQLVQFYAIYWVSLSVMITLKTQKTPQKISYLLQPSH